MKKALVFFGVLAFVVNMGVSADALSDGKKLVQQAKTIWGDSNKLQAVYKKIYNAYEAIGNVDKALQTYKVLSDVVNVAAWSYQYMNASTDAEYIAASKGGSKAMIKALDNIVKLGGGPLYGQIFGPLMKGVEQAVDAIHKRKAYVLYHEWVADPGMYNPGNSTYRHNGREWDWADIAALGYHDVAVEVIHKYYGTARLPLPIAVQIVEALETLKNL